MIIKSLKLENIRSYIDETIIFPKGRVLLSGDIGSGKSSILLSIEFALFGFMKGEINGADLLRHGERTGSIELCFEINNKEIIIKRILKRSSTGIQQESGYLIVDGIKTDLVSKEMKARILKLLGYSENMLNKSKSLIYRYTVYTPQEDMKKIIIINPDERINTLRTIFGIDKYKTIKENISIYNREIKRKISFSEGQIKDIEDIKLNLKNKKDKKEELKKEILIENELIEKIKKDVTIKKDILTSKKKEYEQFQILNNNSKLLDQRIETSKNNIKRIEQRIEIENKRIIDIENEILSEKKLNEEKLLQFITLLKKKIEDEKNKDKLLIKRTAEEDYKIKEQKKISLNITKLENCPTCLQIVDDNHKNKICQKSNEIITNSEKIILDLLNEKKLLDINLDSYEKKLEEYKEIMRKNELFKLKSKMIIEKKDEITKFTKENEYEKINIEKYNSDKILIDNEIRKIQNISIEYEKANKDFLEALKIERDESMKLASIISTEKSLDEIIAMLQNQIILKEDIKKTIFEMKNVSSFFEDKFENMILTIEKQAMNTIYHEFNSLVSDWFNILVGDDNMMLKLDSDFTPIIEQNGYETEISNLSGGEKTAVALSYRLALNKIINEKISNINTKDLMILDEPTEGFSSEQLDRVSDVLKELNLSQIIIVSHETKAEGFVENIIRVEKENHDSKVFS